jgi:hypothetical protein
MYNVAAAMDVLACIYTMRGDDSGVLLLKFAHGVDCVEMLAQNLSE